VRPVATEIVPASEDAIRRAACLLREGALVAFPTETVYGLGGDATNDRAVAAIFAAKGRPHFNPLIVHLPDLAEAEALAVFDDRARRLAASFWPGPLTLVLPRSRDSGVSLLASAGLDTVAVRLPSHPIARKLLRAAGRPIAAPSANRSGRVSPTSAAHVLAEFARPADARRLSVSAGHVSGPLAAAEDVDRYPLPRKRGRVRVGARPLDVSGSVPEDIKVDETAGPTLSRISGESAAPAMILDGGPCSIGIESTVLDLTGKAPVLLRPGGITLEALTETIGAIDIPPADADAAPHSPGRLPSHYAPELPVRLDATDARPGEALLAFGPEAPPGFAAVLFLSRSGNPAEAAANLFAMLRRLDRPEFSGIAVTPIPQQGLGRAINDRLRRAAAPRPHSGDV
jgi:L-threonylcarbamoyladenylate synthase